MYQIDEMRICHSLLHSKEIGFSLSLSALPELIRYMFKLVLKIKNLLFCKIYRFGNWGGKKDGGFAFTDESYNFTHD